MTELSVPTKQREEFLDITKQVEEAVRKSGVAEGMCWVYVPHTTAGITINENADPMVGQDILEHLRRMVPRSQPYFRHNHEQNSDAHIKASLMGSCVWVPVSGGKLQFGRWQGIYFCEFDGPRQRKVWVQILKANP